MNKASYARGTLPGIGELFAAVEQNRLMKAITIIQPWATLIALGEKRLETRSWATKYRGPLAIHAGKKVDREACVQEPFWTVLVRHGYTADNLPTGAVVAIANMAECWEVIGKADVPVSGTIVMSNSTGDRMFGMMRESNEFRIGDYSVGRFAWELNDVQQLPVPIPTKGQQGLWNWQGGAIG